MSDKEKHLLRMAKSGDVEAFEQLIEGYQRKIFNIAFRMLGNYDDAGDMAQEVFIRMYKSISSFKEQSSLSTWIYRITTNVCLDELRKRKNRKITYIDEEIRLDDGDVKRQMENEGPSPEDYAETNEIKKVVRDAILQLPEEYRIIIVLRDIQGFSYEEIAAILKCPEGTVKSRISRARHALGNILVSKKELLIDDYVK